MGEYKDFFDGLIYKIKERGVAVANTIEMLNVVMIFANVDNLALYTDCKVMMGNLLDKKLEMEKNNYLAIQYGLLHKIIYNEFYFKDKEGAINSRKLFVQSDDCISFVQLLPRKELLTVMVFIRSSDVEELLMADLCGVLSAVEVVKKEIYKEPCKPPLDLCVTIGSAHIYPERDLRRIKRSV